MTSAFTRKDIRLPSRKYLGRQIYFITICCHERKPFFSIPKASNWVVEQLLAAARTASFAVHAYCAMPDHLHVLVEGQIESCNLIRFVSAFKQKTGVGFKKSTGKILWQPKYYDHILRRADEVELVATYMWLNPIRKDLCVAPQEYPFSGSQTIDWKNRCAPVRCWTPPWRAAKVRV